MFGRGLSILTGRQSNAVRYSSCQNVQGSAVLMSSLQISPHMGLPAVSSLE